MKKRLIDANELIVKVKKLTEQKMREHADQIITLAEVERMIDEAPTEVIVE